MVSFLEQQSKEIQQQNLKCMGELHPSLLEYRYNRLHYLLPSHPPNLMHVTTSESQQMETLPDSCVGCTPLIDALKAEEYCQQKRKRVMNSLLKESNNCLDSGQSSSDVDAKTSLPTCSISLNNTSSNTKVIQSLKQEPQTPVYHKTPNSIRPSSEGATSLTSTDKGTPTGKETSPNVYLATPMSKDGWNNSTEDNRKLRLAQQKLKKQEWQRKHQQKQESETCHVKQEGVAEDEESVAYLDLITDGKGFLWDCRIDTYIITTMCEQCDNVCPLCVELSTRFVIYITSSLFLAL